MALFNSKKKIAETADVVKREKKNTVSGPVRNLAHILKHARITEKVTTMQGSNIYTFDVAQRATKRDVMQAVRALYKVSPRKVAMVNIRSKTRRNMRTGRVGVTAGGKKAYVYLKQGETITIS